MRILVIMLVAMLSLTAAAETLNPLSKEREQVNVSLVESVESFSADEVIYGSVTTVFTGSAVGFSSVYVTFADSLEGGSYTFEFAYVVGKPKNVMVTKNTDGSYAFSMDVKRYVDLEEYRTETITLNVVKNHGEYIVSKKQSILPALDNFVISQ